MEKRGLQTSEFWVMLVAALVAVGVQLGILDAGSAAEAESLLGEVVEGGAALLVVLGVVWKYIESRTRVKEAAAKGGRQ